MFTFFPKQSCYLLGTLYPMYLSFKALQSQDHALLQRWLTFWFLQSPLTVLESSPVGCSWIPAYWTAKLCFLVYLLFPECKGALKMYGVLLPRLLSYEPKIDNAIESMRIQAVHTLTHLRQQGALEFRRRSAELMTRAHNFLVQLQPNSRKPPTPSPNVDSSSADLPVD